MTIVGLRRDCGILFGVSVVVCSLMVTEARFNVKDLTHVLEVGKTWRESMPGDVQEADFDVQPITKGQLYQNISSGEHCGTHISAPSQHHEQGITLDQILVQNLVVDVAVIDIRHKVLNGLDAQVTVLDLKHWEHVHGRFPGMSIVVMCSDWGKKYDDKNAYFGYANGNVSQRHFPGFHVDAVKWLIDKRVILGVGVDTPGVDYGIQTGKPPALTALMSENLYALENLAGVCRIPQKGARLVILPLNIRGGSGAPARVYVSWQDDLELFKTGYNIVPTSVLDLSHELHNNIMHGWPLGGYENSFRSIPVYNKHVEVDEHHVFWLHMANFQMGDQVGTHIVAPGLYQHEAPSLDHLFVESLVVPVVTIDIRRRTQKDPDAQVELHDIQQFELHNQRITDGSLVLLCSDWHTRWDNETAYWGNADKDSSHFHFPGFSLDAAAFLIEKRSCVGLGSDTPNVDRGKMNLHEPMPVSNLLAEYDLWMLRNVRNSCGIPPRGATVYVGPMKIKGSLIAPARILATWTSVKLRLISENK